MNRFEGRWLVIKPPPDWDAPMSWNHNNASQGFLPSKDVRGMYHHLVEMLTTHSPVPLSSLLSLENFRVTGWGVVMPIAPPPSSTLSNQVIAGVEEEEIEMPGQSSYPLFDPQEEITFEGRSPFIIVFATFYCIISSI